MIGSLTANGSTRVSPPPSSDELATQSLGMIGYLRRLEFGETSWDSLAKRWDRDDATACSGFAPQVADHDSDVCEDLGLKTFWQWERQETRTEMNWARLD